MYVYFIDMVDILVLLLNQFFNNNNFYKVINVNIKNILNEIFINNF